MTTGEIIINLTILAFVVLTQLGTRVVDRRRFIVPLAVVAAVGASYLYDAPAAGHDVAFYLAAAAGTLLGLLAAAFVRVRPGRAGTITARADAAFLAVWLAAIGGRMVFAWAATQTSFGTAVGQFSREQIITGPQAWRAAFVIMALAMVLARLLVLAARTAQLRHAANRPAAGPALTAR